MIGFKEGEYIALTREDPPGFWCAGQKINGMHTTPFRGTLKPDQVKRFEAKKFDYQTTAAAVLAPVAIIILIEAVRSLFPKSSFTIPIEGG